MGEMVTHESQLIELSFTGIYGYPVAVSFGGYVFVRLYRQIINSTYCDR